MTISRGLLIAAVVCFAIATVGVPVWNVPMIPLGLLLLTASKLT